MSFPAYPSYRDSGTEWLSEVPSHWEVARFKTILRERDDRSEQGDEELLSVSAYTGVSPRSQIVEDGDHLSRADSLVGYKRCFPGDLVMNIMLAWNRGLGVTRYAGIVSPAYCVFALSAEVDSGFIDYLSRSNEYIGYYKAFSSGVIDSRLRLYPDTFGALHCGLPPLAEQVAIATFLDRETAKIDALIEEQRRLIALLKEKRQAVISHAVTKGVDPHAPMKDSGIEWLGEVPAHWTVAPLKRTAAVLAGYAFAANAFSHNGDNPRLLRGLNLSASGIRWNEDTVYWERSEGDGLSAWELRAGDVVLGMDRPWIGDGLRVAEITEDDLPCMLVQRVAAIRADCPSAQRFILHCLRHEAFFHHCAPEMTGVSVPHISGGQIEEFRMPIPPTGEMDAIAAYIDTRSNEFAALISAAQSAIELLGERRAALISAAVTGKIDVRGSAKVLPFPVERARARRSVATEIIDRLAHQPTFGRTKLQKVAYLAEAHASITELAGCYIRMPYGPLDQHMMDEIEASAGDDGIVIDDKHDGSMVRYCATGKKGGNTADLCKWLGSERYAKLDYLIKVLSGLKTHSAEAIATLYAVWNDALIEGRSPTDEQIISAFFGWHPKKGENFSPDELPHWLDWMRRHGIVPTGSGPKTMAQTGTLL
ncbi:hypothetical protein [Sphingomonas sp. TX0522]|uniref:hypothetical protein n=1 Tax=Sphingomonas sp. TX0522 TaxID=2479205 RepID=UPI0018DF6BEF|nr:hypothetical protein [Sphingomonas sp. TX0522]MBI0533846.1 restriction endonuclease subunit S [Sphingomonas sp. TX0522]